MNKATIIHWEFESDLTVTHFSIHLTFPQFIFIVKEKDINMGESELVLQDTELGMFSI